MYKGTLEDVVRSMYQVEKKLDAVNPVAVKKKFDDRKDKDIDNDGDVDSSDKYLHKRRKAVSKAVKGEAKKDKEDIEVNPKVDDMREKVQIPDKMTAKMDKIVKSLKKSVKGHAKQAQTIGKLASMDKVDERKLTDKEMKKREDVAQAIKRDNPKMPMDQKMAIATSVAKKTKGEDIIRRGDAKVVKVKGPDGKMMFKKMKPVVKVDDPRDHAMRSEEVITEAEMNYKVSIEGLPDFFVSAKNPGEVKIKMRKMLKKPDMLNNVQRVPDAAMKKHFRLKAQGKDEDEQQPMKEETVMSEDNTNPLVKAVSDILSRNSFNAFRDAEPIQEKEMKSADGSAQAAGGVQDKGAKSNQKANVAGKVRDQETDIKQGASMLHMCAKNVMHEKFGRGECLFGMHADPDENGHVSHYDIMFNHGIEKDMPITECEVLHEREHGKHMKKKPKKDEEK